MEKKVRVFFCGGKGVAGYGRQDSPGGRREARIHTTRRSVRMRSRPSRGGPRFPSQGGRVGECVCVWFVQVSLRGGLCSQLCVSCLVDLLSGAAAVPGQTGSWGSNSCQEPGSVPHPWKSLPPTPTPASPLLGHGPVCRLLRSNPAKRLN